ncbi:MAG: cyclic pyranopterin monophosphate synthase MoaC [Candidatus Omnitrophota bacterium]
MKKKRQTKVSEQMVDIGDKKMTRRRAVACAQIKMSPKAMSALINKKSPKGDVLKIAKIAGIMAAKATSNIIPLCHPLPISHVDMDFKIEPKAYCVRITSCVKCRGRTGVEMEALTAVSIAALTIYDMMKWMDKGIVIADIKLLEKSGGKSGYYKRSQ